ncbi:hypothetical protein Cni_G11107 [Canna indica]|uniref:Uncharacterized protein n=1 Tax=Canna indica TaxID=4628 RepID=A0AAQ3K5G1_9LILI|nr:hypothetical protein Cni_G11107 [Canna indica]
MTKRFPIECSSCLCSLSIETSKLSPLVKSEVHVVPGALAVEDGVEALRQLVVKRCKSSNFHKWEKNCQFPPCAPGGNNVAPGFTIWNSLVTNQEEESKRAVHERVDEGSVVLPRLEQGGRICSQDLNEDSVILTLDNFTSRQRSNNKDAEKSFPSKAVGLERITTKCTSARTVVPHSS